MWVAAVSHIPANAGLTSLIAVFFHQPIVAFFWFINNTLDLKNLHDMMTHE